MYFVNAYKTLSLIIWIAYIIIWSIILNSYKSKFRVLLESCNIPSWYIVGQSAQINISMRKVLLASFQILIIINILQTV